MLEEHGLHETKNRLSEFVKLAQCEGREFLITVRGEPAARLVPPLETARVLRKKAFEKLEAWGAQHPLMLKEGETLKDTISEGRP